MGEAGFKIFMDGGGRREKGEKEVMREREREERDL